VPVRTCTVSFTDTEGLRHSVNVQAESLYEAVALAVNMFREHGCVPGPATAMEVEARSPGVTRRDHWESAGLVGVVGEKSER
jgi:hypothetical protein